MPAGMAGERQLTRERPYASDSGVFRGVEVPHQGEILSMIAHDMRAPLMAIAGALELLSDPGAKRLNFAQTHLVELARQSSDRLRSLAADLTELGAAGSGALRLDRRRHDLSSLVHMAVEVTCLSPYAAGKQVRVAPVERLEVIADGPRLGRALVNVVEHAMRRARSTVSVEVEGKEHEVLVAVEDDGDRLDAAASRLEPAEARDDGGLGLAIVSEIVRAHGGTVAAAERPARTGARFTLRLPKRARQLSRPEPGREEEET